MFAKALELDPHDREALQAIVELHDPARGLGRGRACEARR